MAATVLATANSVPTTPAVSTNMDGSMTGEARQKAITADSGTPMYSKAAISGMTPQEQNGDTPPAAAASRIMTVVDPVKARAISPSAPVAAANAASPIDRTRYGPVWARFRSANTKLSIPCPLSTANRAARRTAEASQALPSFQNHFARSVPPERICSASSVISTFLVI